MNTPHFSAENNQRQIFVIHKTGAIVIRGNKILAVRKAGKDIWTLLGGRVEEGETEEDCLLREIKEEFSCGASIVKKLGDFEDKAVFDDKVVRISAFLAELQGEASLNDPELEEYKFLGKNHGKKLGSILEERIIPFLIKENLLKW